MKTSSALEWDPLAYYSDPFPLYRRMRDDAPVFYCSQLDCWAVFRFADVQQVARTWSEYSSASVGLDDEYRLFMPGSPTAYDPPMHDRLRAVIRGHFTPRVVAAMEPSVRATVVELLAPCVEAGRVDFARDLAFPLPFAMICELLGFDAAARSELSPLYETMMTRPPGALQLPAAAWEAHAAMRERILEAVDERARRPREDLLSTMAHAELKGEIEREEIVGLSVILFVAGIGTTAGLVSNGLYTLAAFPEQRAFLVEEPGRIPDAIDELLRYEAPIQWTVRVATRDVLLGGVSIPSGSRVVMVIGSANRDERRWHDPDILNFDREQHRHASFGEGIHFCVGAPLARLEARVAFEHVLEQMPRYELSGPVEPLRYAPADRALASVPVTF